MENKTVNGITYSRFIASWLRECAKAGRSPWDTDSFKRWLKSINIPDDDIQNIYELMTCGKLELEISAYIWLTKYPNGFDEEDEA